MSRVGSVVINLDDVFGAISPMATDVKNQEVPSRKSTQSSVSTVKEMPISVVSHTSSVKPVTVRAPPQPAQNSYKPADFSNYDQPPIDDPLLNSVFAVVDLPNVNLNGHDQAIRQIDEVLENVEFHFDDENIAYSEPKYSAPSSHISSRVSSKIGSRHSHYESEHHPQNIGSVVSKGSAKNAYVEPPADYNHEKTDDFHSGHQNSPRLSQSNYRDRSNTIDSIASYSESRVGHFDVHDDEDKYTGNKINLHHNEVAYKRPVEHGNSKASSVISHHTQKSYHTGGSLKLKDLERQLNDARHFKAQLTNQIERQKAENDRQRQTNLAYEASLRCDQFVKPIGYSVRSYSHDSSRHSTHEPIPFSQNSPKSIDSSIYEEEVVRVSPLAATQKSAGEHIATVGKYELIVPQYHVVDNFSNNSKINKVIIGGDSRPTDEDKTILLFGPISSGKTSVISSMMNYLYDVKKENPFRFVLDEYVTETTGLTAYVFNNTVLSYNVTVVDTPGIVNEMGNKTVSRLIKQWFEKELLSERAFRLDAISIVLRHDENQIGWPFIYELADVKKMFGDDLKTNVLPIITNSEVLPQPIAIKSLTQANISFLEYYKVNNAGFSAVPKGVSKLQHNLYWTHGIASLENLFRDLQEQVHPLIAILRHDKGHAVEPSPVLADKVLY